MSDSEGDLREEIEERTEEMLAMTARLMLFHDRLEHLYGDVLAGEVNDILGLFTDTCRECSRPFYFLVDGACYACTVSR